MTIEAGRLFVTWFRSGADGRDHAVTDERMSAARRAGGDPVAVCGAEVPPVPLVTPPGPRCHRCELCVAVRGTPPGVEARLRARPHRHRKPSRLRQLLTRLPIRSAAGT
ncbi:hypothetical protein [Amycolatopsis cihanbeyliensis]|uniref:Uncharacterized protein n=1 Tax=Amycolatopsis cihanbeyliensis TaxID=1128664 RepID=A0A542CUT3_AMYCI|nr:hypothetical protein [Amycolatopsis cihanbeyliensis]TQI94578.1 hypothetical protein FB471_6744 [Amycolatopsis cihanbeyliensis]